MPLSDTLALFGLFILFIGVALAYSIESGRSFHPKAAMDSTGFRPLVPDDSGQAVGA